MPLHRARCASPPPSRPLDKRQDLEGKLREVAEHLAEDMAREGLRAKSVMLKVKLSNFEVRPWPRGEPGTGGLPHQVCPAACSRHPIAQGAALTTAARCSMCAPSHCFAQPLCCATPPSSPLPLPTQVKTRNLALTYYVSTADELFAAGQRLLAGALPASIRLLVGGAAQLLHGPACTASPIGRRAQGSLSAGLPGMSLLAS